MSNETKGIFNAVVIVACLLLLGFLVHEKVDGAYVAAIATVTTLVAYFTRQPDKKDPPSGAVVVVGIVGILSNVFACSPATETALQRKAAAELYERMHKECVAKYETREDILACRKRVDDAWEIVQTVSDGGAP